MTDPKQARYKLQDGWWKTWEQDKKLANSSEQEQPAVRWMQGTTGVPFIDANMAELRESGCVLFLLLLFPVHEGKTDAPVDDLRAASCRTAAGRTLRPSSPRTARSTGASAPSSSSRT